MDEFKFRSGQYTGKTLKEVEKINPGYIQWCKENRPEMLRPTIKRSAPPIAPTTPAKRIEPPSDEDAPPSKYLPENRDFLNEGPHGKLY